MGVSICGVKYTFFLFSLARPFFQKYHFSEGKSASATFSSRRYALIPERPGGGSMKKLNHQQGKILKNLTPSRGPKTAFENRRRYRF